MTPGARNLVLAAGRGIEDARRRLDTADPGQPEWEPVPGPQAAAYGSHADVLLYGGAAGGGKTDLLLGLAMREHRKSVIFRRVFPSLHGIAERSKEMYAGRGAFNESKNSWKFQDGRRVRFRPIQHEKDKRGQQGQAHDFMGFDEITEFTESQFRFVTAWNRTTRPGQRCRVVCTGNPPTSADGEWVISYWAPWLDPGHANPAEPGELRWFTSIGGKDTEVGGPDPFEIGGKLVTPLSRTFIPAKVQDNPYLAETGYVAHLEALPEPLRSKLLFGDFTKGRDDDPYQVVPAEWVRLAQGRWSDAPGPDGPMTAMGVDVARGGSDRTVIAARHCAWFAELRTYPGASTPDGPAVAALVLAQRRDGAAINVDVIGVGSSVYDHLRGTTDNVVAINSSERSEGADRSGELRFVNLRAELWWRMREALDPVAGEGLCLPPDRELAADLCAPRWRLTLRGIQVEGKDELRRRLGRSTDKGDAAVYALASVARRGAGIFGWFKEMAGKIREGA